MQVNTAGKTPKSQRGRAGKPGAAAEDTIGRIVIEIRKFLAGGIFFNAQAAERAALSVTDMQMINILDLYGPATPSRLAAATKLSSGGVTVALDRLGKAGYIRREPNPADRRSLMIALVPAKVRKLMSLYEGIDAQTRRLLATMNERDLEAVVRFFDTLAGVRSAPL